uniref:Uncharacterized protein n=1 Tax=Cacopsylla melanoneura TaxID=428564 RepID=A0A8D8YKJ5_9HEMI
MKLIVGSLFVLVLIGQVQSGFKFICNQCAKDNSFVGFDEEDKFLEHCDLHTKQQIEAQHQLKEDARLLEEQEANAPKLFHCHFCPFVSSFNSSAEFVSHIEQEHQHTTIEENTDFIPQGKYKVKGGAARTPGGFGGAPPPDLGQLFGGRGGGGGFGGGGYGGNIPLDGFGEGGGVQMDGYNGGGGGGLDM